MLPREEAFQIPDLIRTKINLLPPDIKEVRTVEIVGLDLQADGGTRTASITGAFVALHDCLKWMHGRSMLNRMPIKDHVAAISCGISNGTSVLDLDYAEDSQAETDANFVMTGSGGLIEIQGTAEGAPFSEAQFTQMMGLARDGITQLIAMQKSVLAQS